MKKVAVILLQIASLSFLLLVGSCSDDPPEMSFSQLSLTQDSHAFKSETTGFRVVKDFTSNPGTEEATLSFPVKVEGIDAPIDVSLSVLPLHVFKDAGSDKTGDYYIIEADFTAHNAALKDKSMFMKEFTASLQPTDVNGNAIPGIKFYSEPTPTTTEANKQFTSTASNSLRGGTVNAGTYGVEDKVVMEHQSRRIARDINRVGATEEQTQYIKVKGDPFSRTLFGDDRLFAYDIPQANGQMKKYLYFKNFYYIDELNNKWFELDKVNITDVCPNVPELKGVQLEFDLTDACEPPHLFGSDNSFGLATVDYGPIQDIWTADQVVHSFTQDELSSSIFSGEGYKFHYAAVASRDVQIGRMITVPNFACLAVGGLMTGFGWSVNQVYYRQDLSTILNTNNAGGVSYTFKVENIDSERGIPAISQSDLNGHATWVLKMPVDETTLTQDQLAQSLFNIKVEVSPIYSELAHKEKSHYADDNSSLVKTISLMPPMREEMPMINFKNYGTSTMGNIKILTIPYDQWTKSGKPDDAVIYAGSSILMPGQQCDLFAIKDKCFLVCDEYNPASLKITNNREYAITDTLWATSKHSILNVASFDTKPVSQQSK